MDTVTRTHRIASVDFFTPTQPGPGVCIMWPRNVLRAGRRHVPGFYSTQRLVFLLKELDATFDPWPTRPGWHAYFDWRDAR